jgi:hypothetical protein
LEEQSIGMCIAIEGANKRAWDQFVDESPQGSIYCKTWWLDAVCPGAYELVTIRKSGVIRAGIALPLCNDRGLRRVHMPPLTQTLGPLLNPRPADKYASRLDYEMKLLRELVASIPITDAFFANCSSNFTNWLPFHWAGYAQTTRYSYVFENLRDLNEIHAGMTDKARNIIRKAERSGIRIEESDDLDSAVDLVRRTYTRQGLEFPYDVDLIRRIDLGARTNAGRKILFARDPAGRIHAAVYLVFDRERTYHVMQGADPELRSSGAPMLAQWHAIQFASTASRNYDLVGSMIEKVERVFRSLGAVQRPYFSLFRQGRLTLRQIAAMGMTFARQRLLPGAALVLYWSSSEPCGSAAQLILSGASLP